MSKNTQKTKIDGDNTGDIAGGDINKGNSTSFHLKLPALVRLSLLVASGTVVVKMGWVNTIIQNFQNNNPSTTYSSPSPNSKHPSVAVPSNSLIPKQTSPINVTPNIIEGQKVARIESIVGKIDGKIPDEKELYLYVKAPALQDFPFYYFPVTVRGQTWTSSAIFGAVGDGNQGLLFETGLVLADPKDKKWRNKNSDNGIADFIGEPVGSKVTVQRK